MGDSVPKTGRNTGSDAVAGDYFRRVRLYVLVTAAACSRDWFETALATIDGGADCLQLREPALPDAELLRRARRLAEACRERRVPFIMNNRPDIARLVDADGVHVGQHDLPVAAVRRIVREDVLVGVSTHDSAELSSALAGRPDYVAVGRMFPSRTKPSATIAGVPFLREALAASSVPVVAIGGITAENAGELLEAGARCLAVCEAVVSTADPAAAAARLRELMTGAIGAER